MVPKNIFSDSRRRGFTLLEMGIVLTIIGVVVAAGVAIFPKILEKKQAEDTQARFNVLKKAMLDYRMAHNRLPCPADITLALTDANYGMEAVNTTGLCIGGSPSANAVGNGVARGGVPVRTLQLPDDYALDGWGRRINYNIDHRYTENSAFINHDVNSDGVINLKIYGGSDTTATATYLGSDFTTRGKWIGKYGKDGYVIVKSTNATGFPSHDETYYDTSFPVAATDAIVPGSVYITNGTSTVYSATYAAGATDLPSCLEKPPDGTSAPACALLYAGASNFNIAVNLPAGTSADVSIYALDRGTFAGNSAGSRNQKVTVATSTQRLATSSYIFGAYQTWRINGYSLFQVEEDGTGTKAVVGGVFIDNIRGAPGAPVYLLISGGADGHGAYPKAGGEFYIDNGSTDASSIANSLPLSLAQGSFSGYIGDTIPDVYSNNSFFQGVPRELSTVATRVFDDMVAYASRRDLKSAAE